jgi:hypothetical protein
MGVPVPVGQVIAKYVHSKEEYFIFKDSQRILLGDQAKFAAVEKEIEDSSKKPDTKTLLKEVRHLISNDYIKDGSGTSITYSCNCFNAHQYPYHFIIRFI